jgi:hypothetical protein
MVREADSMKITFIAGMGLVVGLCLASDAYAWQAANMRCPYLDGRPRPFFEAELGYIGEAKTGGNGPRYAQMELRLGADLFYFHDLLHGDLDFAFRADSIFPVRKAALNPPAHLIEGVLEIRWLWRYVNQTAFFLQLDPGFYASTEDLLDMPLAMPVTAAGIYTLDATLAFVGGLSLRPGFYRLVMPCGGVVWHPHPQFRVDATVPDARVTMHLDRLWSVYAGWLWDSTTYHVKPDSAGRNRLTLESKELYLGFSHTLSDELQIIGSLGLSTDRHARVTRSRDGLRSTASIDDAVVFRIGVAGAF